jgi:uncharacterized lipoprotein YmbA
MRRSSLHLIAATLLPLLAGCASTPAKYYTLDMRPSGGAAAAVNITVDHIRVSDALAGKNIYIQQSPTEVTFYAAEQWTAPIDDLVREKLQAEFGDPQPGRRSLALSGTIMAFSQVDVDATTAEATVRLQAALREAGASRYEKPLLDRTYTATQRAAAPTAAEVVIALSRCIEALAAEIARDAAAL